mgnify:CR=1 FL=1
MAFLEITTTEIANTVPAYINAPVSKIKGMREGFSFEADIEVGGFSKSVPLKVEFIGFEPEDKIVVLEIQLNSDNFILKKGFDKIVNSLSRFLPEEKLPPGVKINGTHIYIKPQILLNEKEVPVFIEDVKIEESKAKVNFSLLNKF